LSTDAWPAGVGLIALDVVDSTNAEAARRAPGLDRPTWIVARRQTAARGRRGRAWATAPGNLSATLVMRPEGGAAAAALRTFVAGLALFDAVVAVTGRAGGLALKWPNDVLLNGGKLAGILLESSGSGPGVAHLAVGFGVNLAAAPAPAEVEARALRPVSLAGETGLCVTPDDIMPPLAAAFAHWEGRLAAEGFAPLRAAFLDRAAHLGSTITARTGTATLQGRYETIDGTGALVLQTAAGRRIVPAADIFLDGGHDASGD